LAQLSNASHQASIATVQYFALLHPNAPAFVPLDAAGIAAINSSFSLPMRPPTRGGAALTDIDDDDAMTVVNGKPVKRSRKGKKEKKIRDPNEPKRPLTAFFVFNKHAKPQITQDLPGATKGEVSKEITERWNSMTLEEKQPYRDLYQAAMIDYREEMEKYKANKALEGSNDEGAAAAEAPAPTPAVAKSPTTKGKKATSFTAVNKSTKQPPTSSAPVVPASPSPAHSSDEDEGASDSAQQLQLQQQTAASKNNNENHENNSDSDSDMSSLIDNPPPVKVTKKAAAASSKRTKVTKEKEKTKKPSRAKKSTEAVTSDDVDEDNDESMVESSQRSATGSSRKRRRGVENTD